MATKLVYVTTDDGDSFAYESVDGKVQPLNVTDRTTK